MISAKMSISKMSVSQETAITQDAILVHGTISFQETTILVDM